MMKYFLLAFLAIATMADPVHYDKIIDEINQTMDEAIQAFEKSPTMDPLSVPDHTEKFERHVSILDFKGELTIHDMKVYGLKQLRRQGNAQVKEEGGEVKGHVFLAAHDKTITIESNLEYHLADLHPTEHLVSDIQDFAVELRFVLDSQGNLTMTDFEVREFANVEHHIGGLSVLNPIFGVLSDVLTVVFNGPLRDELTKVLAPAFKKELEKKHEMYYF